MKSSSDNSDYEDDNVDDETDKALQERKQKDYFRKQSPRKKDNMTSRMSSSLTMEEDHSADEEGDYKGEYYKSFNQRDVMKFVSHNMYQDTSGEQDSNDEYEDQDLQYEKVHDRPSTYSIKKEEDSGNLKRTSNNLSEDSSDEEFDRPKKFMSIEAQDGTTSKKALPSNSSKYESATNISLGTSNNRQKLDVPKLDTKQTGFDKAKQMMQKMGYTEGHGLGKNKQGRLEPVEASRQHGRRGLGHHIPGLQAASLKWDASEEEIKVMEEIDWLKNIHPSAPTMDEMEEWIKMGPKKETIDDETNFCDPEMVHNVCKVKTIFDNMDKVEMRRARTRSNPFETIRGACFLNRAAVKMANMDTVCNFMFTKPDLRENELLYFADVCAGPGGFSEYVLSRKKWHAKGFGFTLKNENDFQLSEFHAGPSETFHPYYGPKEDGDVFDPSNQDAFRELVLKHTDGKGVHFMMADGGFSVEGQENIQEILSKQLYLCQCLVALMIVRQGGHFITKLFDLFTPFSAGLIYLMYRCFDEISIFKPNTSRPANSERYLICKKKRADTQDVMLYLSRVNHLLLKRDDHTDVAELVPFEELEGEKNLVEYLRRSNNILGRRQITGLLKIAAFCEDSSLIESRQADMRKECLEYWNIKEGTRTLRKPYIKPADMLRAFIKGSPITFLTKHPTELTKENMSVSILNQPYDWFYLPCSTSSHIEKDKMATFYVGMGGLNVYRFTNGYWSGIEDNKIELPANTLVYAELVNECIKEFRSQQKFTALHILDAYLLGGEDISSKSITGRHELIKKFCKALWRPNNMVHIRAKELYPLNRDIDKILQVQERIMKNNRPALVHMITKTPFESAYDHDEELYFVLRSILFLRSTAQPWSTHVSKTHNRPYIWNRETQDKKFDYERPAESEAQFAESFETRIVWNWPEDTKLDMKSVAEEVKNRCPDYNRKI